MCSYITLVAQGDPQAAASVLTRHKRGATPVDNPSLRQVLRKGETQLLTTVGQCDCGTMLGNKVPTPRDHDREVEKLRKKGWSQAKIDRAMQDQKRADQRPDSRPTHDFAFWAQVLRDVIAAPGVTGAGVFVHFYSGAVESEKFNSARRDVKATNDLENELAKLRDDELLFVAAT